MSIPSPDKISDELLEVELHICEALVLYRTALSEGEAE
jgi:hypothetical protein